MGCWAGTLPTVEASPQEEVLGSRLGPVSTGCTSPASPARWPGTIHLEQRAGAGAGAGAVQMQPELHKSLSPGSGRGRLAAGAPHMSWSRSCSSCPGQRPPVWPCDWLPALCKRCQAWSRHRWALGDMPVNRGGTHTGFLHAGHGNPVIMHRPAPPWVGGALATAHPEQEEHPF